MLMRDSKNKITMIHMANDVAGDVDTSDLREKDCSGRVYRQGSRVGSLSSLLTGFTRKTIRLRLSTCLSDDRLESLAVPLPETDPSRDEAENEDIAGREGRKLARSP